MNNKEIKMLVEGAMEILKRRQVINQKEWQIDDVKKLRSISHIIGKYAFQDQVGNGRFDLFATWIIDLVNDIENKRELVEILFTDKKDQFLNYKTIIGRLNEADIILSLDSSN
jgi:hypothetical protein